jgi:hypothetical protein
MTRLQFEPALGHQFQSPAQTILGGAFLCVLGLFKQQSNLAADQCSQQVLSGIFRDGVPLTTPRVV